MDYAISFLEGIITFISPCLLPMLPIYFSFFAGRGNEGKKSGLLLNALAFVLGFTIVFVALGAFAGTLGSYLTEHQRWVNLVLGLVMIVFGLHFMQLIHIPLLNTERRLHMKHKKNGLFSAMIFGIVFSLGWTPCVGAFLGSALMLAASAGDSFKGILMLLSFSLGLGIPFVASALLIDELKSTFDFIKRHYRAVQLFSGGLLVLMGILMATGIFGYFLALFSF